MKPARLVTALAGALVALGSGASQAQDVTLRIHHFLSAKGTIQAQVLEPWCATLGR